LHGTGTLAPAIVESGAGEIKKLPGSGFITRRSIAEKEQPVVFRATFRKYGGNLRVRTYLGRERGVQATNHLSETIFLLAPFKNLPRLIAKSDITGTTQRRREGMRTAPFTSKKIYSEADQLAASRIVENEVERRIRR
jgi:hypothetical protein